MEGFLGTGALFKSDLSLVLTLVFGLVAVAGRPLIARYRALNETLFIYSKRRV